MLRLPRAPVGWIEGLPLSFRPTPRPFNDIKDHSLGGETRQSAIAT